MPRLWKVVLIGSEVTVLAAFTAAGVHLVMRPHRSPITPPPITLPASSPDVLPPVALAPSSTTHAVIPSPPSRDGKTVTPDLLAKLNRDDARQLALQWDIVERLVRGVVQYIERRLLPEVEGRR